MAYDKIIVIRSRMDHCLDYVLNEEKTDLANALHYAENPQKTQQLVTAINCTKETAYQEMQSTKQRWDKCGGTLGYHLIHSYAPGEVTPELAHEAGVAFATELLGKQYEAVVTTHLDQAHLHCHIVFNSVSFVDGKKYRDDFKSYFGDIRSTSNAVSQAYGLSVITPTEGGKHYAQWDAERQGKTTIKDLVKQDIDDAIAHSFTYDGFLSTLRQRGYTVKHGENVKHTAIRPPGGERFFRLNSLKEGYTEADIRGRLSAIRSGEQPLPPTPTITPKRYTIKKGQARPTRPKLHGFQALYVYYLCFLRHGKPKRGRLPPFSIRKDIIKLQRYQQQFQLMRTYRIANDTQLSMLTDALQAQIDAQVGARTALYRRRRAGEHTTPQIEQINGELRQLRRTIKTCTQITSDIPHIREQSHQCRSWTEQSKEQTTHRKDRNQKTSKGVM